ncbi:hypothetical protein SAMN02927921_03194 [Sinomicrobium oceani]|uniref:Uncharacterized protein n=1 Tax=Sinomicrobium oceani TaxID=1150368 RepID=A0A1K1R6C9_9FLAO|nr:hypothetical protein SAMN02927921_03194 [Sinomicrobium oceani]
MIYAFGPEEGKSIYFRGIKKRIPVKKTTPKGDIPFGVDFTIKHYLYTHLAIAKHVVFIGN